MLDRCFKLQNYLKVRKYESTKSPDALRYYTCLVYARYVKQFESVYVYTSEDCHVEKYLILMKSG